MLKIDLRGNPLWQNTTLSNQNKKIKEIYEASCFKMDPIFVLEFDKKKYYELLNEQKIAIQNEANNSND